jgi:type IX secretion system substrate protein
MKNFTLIVLFFFSTAFVMAQDTIANGNFAAWTNFPANGYNEPNDWNSPNPQTSIISLYTCLEDSSIVYSGDHFSCHLVTLYLSLISSNVPGTISTGVIPSGQGQSISGGAPIHSRPTAITGWFAYAPAGLDTGGVSISLYKAGVVIGAGGLNFTNTDTVWTAFTCPITYTSDSVPDTSQMTFVSSTGNGVAKSSLWLDDLNYSYVATGIAKTEMNAIRIYPNPASSQLNIDNQTMLANSLNLYAADGQLVKLIKMHGGMNTVNISSLAAGTYLLSGTSVDGRAFSSSVVITK